MQATPPVDWQFIGVVISIVTLGTGTLIGLGQMVISHFWGAQGSDQANKRERLRVEHERDQAFIRIERESLLDSARWREVLAEKSRETERRLQDMASGNERQHGQNQAAIERNSRMVERLAEEIEHLRDRLER